MRSDDLDPNKTFEVVELRENDPILDVDSGIGRDPFERERSEPDVSGRPVRSVRSAGAPVKEPEQKLESTPEPEVPPASRSVSEKEHMQITFVKPVLGAVTVECAQMIVHDLFVVVVYDASCPSRWIPEAATTREQAESAGMSEAVFAIVNAPYTLKFTPADADEQTLQVVHVGISFRLEAGDGELELLVLPRVLT